ncbi:MAG: ComEC/Rec2 family competence protein [Patescibacteria group bacterium]|nr:ComEC/Rec2 family competence protein [Patescibacteria group bacterium]
MKFTDFAAKQKPAVIMLSFLSGIAIHSFFPLTPVPTFVWWGIAGLMLVGLIFRKPLSCSCGRGVGVRAQRWDSDDVVKQGIPRLRAFSLGTTLGMTMSFLVIGLLRFDIAIPRAIDIKESQTFVGVLTDVNDGLFGKQGTIAIQPPFSKGGRGNQLITINLKTSLPLGSAISFSCALKPVAQKPDELDRRFAYRLHFSQATCSPKDLTVIKPPAWWDVRQSFVELRAWTNLRIKSILPGDEGALIAGMLYGERGMSQQSNNLFRNAGLTHLIAVSGSNITIVASIVFAILLGIGLWRRQAFWVTTVTLLAYVTFTGFSASVARAAVMGWLVLFARYIGRRPKTWHVLLVSAFALCLLDPWMLAFDAGFALSFLATIGLMSWSPIFSRLLKFLPEIGGLREAAATTISATLMTTPYMAFAFEKISLAGLVTNLIAVPLVPWAMLFGAISAAWGQLYGWQFVTLPALGVAKLIFWSAHLSDYVPWLLMEIQRMNFVLLVATYFLLTWIWFKLRAKKSFSTTQACELSKMSNIFDNNNK